MAKKNQDIRLKEEKKAARAARRAQRKQTFAQVWQAFKLQKEHDKALLPWMLVAFFLPIALLLLLSLVWGYWWLNLILGIVLGATAAMWVFSRRLQTGMYKRIEGEPGAAGWALQNMRDGVGMKWITEPGVAMNKHMDAVHRVVGSAGIVLVGEGSRQRLKPLMSKERAALARIIKDVPITDVYVGDGEGEVPISKLQTHLMKLPRAVKKADVDALNSKVQSIAKLNAPMSSIPKGPLPKGGNMAGMNRRARRAAARSKGN